MVDRGLPIVDGAPACPFVAFEDDRDARATAPDHRHRCYAEPRPAPRALAHQDAYCLSSNFPVCPTFQDWARREAAAARPGSAAPVYDPRQEPESPPQSQPLPPPEREARHAPAEPLPPRRNPPRDWAAPPPWQPDGADGPAGANDAAAAAAAGFAAASSSARDAGPPESRGLAGSAADRLAAGRSPVDDRLSEPVDLDDDDAYDAYRGYDAPTGPPAAAAPEPGDRGGWGEPRATDPLPAPPIPRYGETDDDRPDDGAGYAAVAAGASAGAPADPYAPPTPPRQPQQAPAPRASSPPRQSETWSDPDADDDEDERYPYAPPPPRRYVDRARDRGAATTDTRPPKDDGHALFGPAWERPRRNEAYPTLRSRMSMPVPGLPGLSRVALALGALALGVLVLFFLPGMLDIGGTGGPGSDPTASPSSAASITPEPSPTATPAPTPIVHVVAQGETLSKIAKKYGLTLDQLLAANPQIKNPNKIAIGDELTIPTPTPSDDELGASEEPSAS
jgi:hypothetical protein